MRSSSGFNLALSDFDYELPKELIALYPEKKRSEARLLVADRKTGELQHRIFKDIIEYLGPGDLLVLNNTKVIPARLFGVRPTGGRVEALLLKRAGENVWAMLVKPSGRIKKGSKILFGENGVRLEGEVLDEPDKQSGIRRIHLSIIRDGSIFPSSEKMAEKIEPSLFLRTILNQIGHIPLPPYIDRPDEALDRELYQTVFAEIEGAVASPTAGLHFDEELLNSLERKGVEICFVTLHVGYGTFQPVQAEELSKHEMHEEEFEISETTSRQIKQALKENKRIVACGTTAVRTLETVGPRFLESRETSFKETTQLFIYPPYEFKIVDAIITNFHLPRTTLLMLVSAFSGHELMAKTYEEAIRSRYRFYSYGDAMLIV